MVALINNTFISCVQTFFEYRVDKIVFIDLPAPSYRSTATQTFGIELPIYLSPKYKTMFNDYRLRSGMMSLAHQEKRISVLDRTASVYLNLLH